MVLRASPRSRTASRAPSCQPERAVPEDAGGVNRAGLEQQDRERSRRGDERTRRRRPASAASGARGTRPRAARAPVGRTSSSRRAPRPTPRGQRRASTSQKPRDQEERRQGVVGVRARDVQRERVGAPRRTRASTAKRCPPKRRPTSARPSRQSRSNTIDRRSAPPGRSSHLPGPAEDQVRRARRPRRRQARTCRPAGSPDSQRPLVWIALADLAVGVGRAAQAWRESSTGKCPYGDWPFTIRLRADHARVADVDHVRGAHVQADAEARR